MADESIPVTDFEDAQRAFERVEPELAKLQPAELTTMNTDVVSATSIAIGCAPRILEYRSRLAKQAEIGELNLKHVDSLLDYAKATWYAYVTNLPVPEPAVATALLAEVATLRAKLLLWATPLAASGVFDQVAIDKIKDGAGYKDASSDLVALIGLYRARWETVKNMCAVTEADLERGSQIGPATFALISRRENKLSVSTSEGSLRVRRAFTLLDRAYEECRRYLALFRYYEGDVNRIAPSLRRNAGPSAPKESAAEVPAEPAPATTPNAGQAPAVGGGGGPFISPKS